MKNIISILFTLMLLVGLQSNVYGQATSDRDFFEVQVDGLGCPFCAYGLEKKFKEFKGIKNIKIDMETGDFSFTFPNEKALDLKDVESQVDAAGYTAVTVKVTRSNGEVLEITSLINLREKRNGGSKETVEGSERAEPSRE